MASNLFSLANTGVGFDHLFDRLDRLYTKSLQNASYPPYNIKKVEDNKYVIELAVAGFAKHELELELEENVLTVKGGTTLDTELADGVDQTYLFKGIANRNFTRKFTLADSVKINNASLVNGMLKVWLENVIPESKKPKKIEIDGEQDSSKSTQELLTEKL